jgi:hypothetical protein
MVDTPITKESTTPAAAGDAVAVVAVPQVFIQITILVPDPI